MINKFSTYSLFPVYPINTVIDSTVNKLLDRYPSKQIVSNISLISTRGTGITYKSIDIYLHGAPNKPDYIISIKYNINESYCYFTSEIDILDFKYNLYNACIIPSDKLQLSKKTILRLIRLIKTTNSKLKIWSNE